MPAIGPAEIVVVLVIALLILGPKKLPDLGRNLGTGMREFKASISGEPSAHADVAAAPHATEPTRAQA